MWRSSALKLSAILLASSISYPVFSQGIQLSSLDVTRGCASLGANACDDLSSIFATQREGLATRDRDIADLVAALAAQARAVDDRSDVNITCPEIATVIMGLADAVSSSGQSAQIMGIAQALCTDGIQTAAIPTGTERDDDDDDNDGGPATLLGGSSSDNGAGNNGGGNGGDSNGGGDNDGGTNNGGSDNGNGDSGGDGGHEGGFDGHFGDGFGDHFSSGDFGGHFGSGHGGHHGDGHNGFSGGFILR